MDGHLFLILILLCIFTHLVRLNYEILKHKKIIRPTRLTFVIIFTNMFLLWTTWFLLCELDTFKLTLPAVLKYAGLSFVIIGIILFLTALFTIKSLETYEGSLITNGIYSVVRHPMYLGFLFWIIGMPTFTGGVYSLILIVPFCINILYWRHLEEIELENRFTDYKFY